MPSPTGRHATDQGHEARRTLLGLARGGTGPHRAGEELLALEKLPVLEGLQMEVDGGSRLEADARADLAYGRGIAPIGDGLPDEIEYRSSPRRKVAVAHDDGASMVRLALAPANN